MVTGVIMKKISISGKVEEMVTNSNRAGETINQTLERLLCGNHNGNQNSNPNGNHDGNHIDNGNRGNPAEQKIYTELVGLRTDLEEFKEDIKTAIGVFHDIALKGD